MEKLDDILFYSIDKAIRSYRQYAQQKLKNAGFTITIDQWLIIKCILENPAITQNELADLVFKDNASITRMIDLLVKGKYLKRKSNNQDRRRFKLEVTEIGIKVIEDVHDIVKENRKVALTDIDDESIKITKKVLEQIALNTRK